MCLNVSGDWNPIHSEGESLLNWKACVSHEWPIWQQLRNTWSCWTLHESGVISASRRQEIAKLGICHLQSGARHYFRGRVMDELVQNHVNASGSNTVSCCLQTQDPSEAALYSRPWVCCGTSGYRSDMIYELLLGRKPQSLRLLKWDDKHY